MNPIAIAVLCVLGTVVVVLAFLPLMTKPAAYVPPPKRGSWAPPDDPGTLPNVKPSNPKVCLPGTLGYQGLVTCTRQTDCKSCTDDSTLECITITNTNNQIVNPTTQKLDPPVPIHLYKKANGVCSGRGTQKSCNDPNAPDNCKDYWCDCGTQYTHANSDVTNCDVQILNVTDPGTYCLPSYVNACNPYTSDTVLSNTGVGPEWTCECKYNDPQLFQQNAEGTDCSVPIACSSQEPQLVGSNIVKVMSYQNTDSSCQPVPGSTNANWQFCDSYPNQLVSSNPVGNVNCTVPTVKTTVPVDNEYSYVQYNVSPLADPKCTIQGFSNTCTVQTAFDSSGDVVASQVIRGTGNPNDPHLSRVWPPFPSVLPVNMQACPDGWTGSGTNSSPCTDGKGFKLSYLDSNGQWNGRYLSLQELRNVGYNSTSATTCDTNSATNSDCKAPEICSGAGICATPCSSPNDCASLAGTGCVNGVCSAINDTSCNVSTGVSAVGLPGTLGAIPWNTVNNACTPVPRCLESQQTLQSIPRSWSTPSNLFPVTTSNMTSSLCAGGTTPAPSCTCPIAAQKKMCQKDGECGVGNVCNTLPVNPFRDCTGDSDCNVQQGQFCKNGVCTAGLCTCGVDGSTYTCSDPPAGELCSAATGYQPRLYNGAVDGPVVDDNGNSLGGRCSCAGFVIDNGQRVPLIPGALLDPSLAWTCVPDPCFVPGSNSYYDSTINRCVCHSDSQGNTYYSWNMNNGVPSCQRDPCNNSGVTSPIQVSCKTDDQCSSDAVTCSNNSCYIWTGKSCDPAAGNKQCVEGIGGGQSVECLQNTDSKYYCAVQDSTRSACSKTSDCALGICNKATQLCTGGCVCSAGTAPYFTDANPLHSACTNPCIFNPCGSNGTCQTDGGSSFKCVCNPGYSGDSCENKACIAPAQPCSNDSDCCSNSCTYKLFQGYLCDT